MTAILSLSNASDRRAAARATAGGAALFYGFGNICALAALPDHASVVRINRLKGRPAGQAGSVTSDPSRLALAFDWSQVAGEREIVFSMMADFMALGPIGFRGPAAAGVPDHLTVRDGTIRTVQHISPGVRCRSNALVRETLELTGEDMLFISSANRHGTRQVEPAHYEMAAIPDEFGHRNDVVLIGHEHEDRNRLAYPRHLPCSTSVVSFHRDVRDGERPAIVLERHGSLGIDDVRDVAARHGYGLKVAPGGYTRLPVRGMDRLVA